MSETKAEIRERIWDALVDTGTARFPFPPQGRIPNFAGARDLPLAFIAPPERTIEVPSPPQPPAGLDWSRIPEARIAAMPILAELRQRRDSGGVRP